MPKRLSKTMASFLRNHQSIIIKPIQQAQIIRSASQNLRLQASDGRLQASDGHPKPAYVHPKLMNGDFARLYGGSSHGSGMKYEGRWESCQIGFVAYSSWIALWLCHCAIPKPWRRVLAVFFCQTALVCAFCVVITVQNTVFYNSKTQTNTAYTLL